MRIYLGTELIKMHARQAVGGRSTDPSDYPKDKAAYAFRDIDRLLDEAGRRGDSVGEYAHALLGAPLPWRHMRQVYALLRLCEKYGAARVDAACARALAFDVLDVRRIRRMLETSSAAEAQAEQRGKLVQLPLLPARFARSDDSFRTLKNRDDETGGAR
ncbi:MAG: hypothetical protein KC503_07755 [Myxococcales bacterium]|nr:hypothetical protein [Myxococcales bacterium]